MLQAEQLRLQKMTEHAQLQKQTADVAKSKANEAVELTKLMRQREQEELRKLH